MAEIQFAKGKRKEAIENDRPRDVIFEYIKDEVEDKADEFGILNTKADDLEKELKDFHTWAMQTFPIRLPIEELKDLSGDAIVDKTIEEINEAYRVKEEAEDPEALKRLERVVLISTIDRHYQNHLTEMEDLRQSVGLRGYGQKDPLVEYKNEAFTYFNDMMATIQSEISSAIFRSVTNVRAFENMLARDPPYRRAEGGGGKGARRVVCRAGPGLARQPGGRGADAPAGPCAGTGRT